MADRRRFLSIVAACAAAAPFAGARVGTAEAVEWRGTAMGALASMTLVHPDRAKAQALVQRCVDEIDRLESMLSLYRPDSSLSRLNAAGELRDPPVELVTLMSQSLALARSSGGAFDPTVQPLYRLYAAHFARPAASVAGPSPAAIVATLRDVGFAGVELRADHIRLRRPGMGITLNGVAQGFVTDRVADLLRDAGLVNLMIDLGEARAHGRSARGDSWRAAIADPRQPYRTLLELPLGDDAGTLPALATSAGYGTLFGTDPRIHHLFDPGTGRSANRWLSVSVAAPRATVADGLSTALSVMPADRAARLLADYPSVRAWLVQPDGEVTVLGRGTRAEGALQERA
ncbi:MAG: FAD:protein FMN transferase [Burkholderiaceae bacterium]|jgi:thiamine biosynthesis lipoprotein|nr:FAD:protein FMN transferase [Burkholderiaceae bacterium]MEB2350953.1 FAD:protein FMN transferase [Burkholderiaceae bacterium]